MPTALNLDVVPDYLSKQPKGAQLLDLIGFIHLCEKFRFKDLLNENEEVDQEISEFSPVYKNTLDKYLGSDSENYALDTSGTKQHNIYYTKDYVQYPIFRTFFDWTSVSARNLIEWPLQVQTRIQFVEPEADTIQPVGSRRILRGGNLQFFISTIPTDIESEQEGSQPLSEAAKIAQYYVDKYSAKDAAQILATLPDVKQALEVSSVDFPITNGFMKGITEKGRSNVLRKLFDRLPLDVSDPNHIILSNTYDNIFDRVRSLTFFVASVSNLRFTPLEAPTTFPVRQTDSIYVTAVTIPFAFEQEK